MWCGCRKQFGPLKCTIDTFDTPRQIARFRLFFPELKTVEEKNFVMALALAPTFFVAETFSPFNR